MGVFRYIDFQVEIAVHVGGGSGMPLATESDLGSLDDALGNLDRDGSRMVGQRPLLIEGR